MKNRKIVGIVSPPYSEAQERGGGIAVEGYRGKHIKEMGKNQPDKVADRCGYRKLSHGNTEGQIANLPDKKIVGIISPPYSDGGSSKFGKGNNKWFKEWREMQGRDNEKKGAKGIWEGYNPDNPKQIANLKDNKRIIGIISPPYERSMHDSEEKRAKWNTPELYRKRVDKYQHGYSENPLQIGNLEGKEGEQEEFDITQFHSCDDNLYWTGCYSSDKTFKKFIHSDTYCFDIETEILTENGWKKYNDLKEGKNIATLNKTTNHLEYQPIQKVWILIYEGKMYKLKTKQINLLVTPSHRLFVSFGNSNKFKFITPIMAFGKNKSFKKDAIWKGKNIDYFILPEIKFIREISEGKKRVRKEYVKEEKKIPIDKWLKFFGFWLAEGSISGKYNINLSNNKKEILEEIKNDLEPYFKPHIYCHENKFQLVILDIQLVAYLLKFRGSKNKFIPFEIKQLSSDLLKIFLDYYLKGDGSIRMMKNSQRARRDAWTISPKLRDDLLEIALKIGIGANYYERNRIGKITYDYRNKKYVTRNIEYCINFTSQTTPFIQKRHKTNIEKWIDFSGIVWCVTTKNGIVYVRRKGRTYWCGQSHPAKASMILMDKIFKHLKKLGLLKQGDIICDFMSGSGRTNIMASLHGFDSIAIELEPHFIKMINQNKELLEKKTGRKFNWEIIQGDSRKMTEILKEKYVAIVSPPYANESTPTKETEWQKEHNWKSGHQKEDEYTKDNYRFKENKQKGNIGKTKTFRKIPCSPDDSEAKHDNRIERKGTKWEWTKEVEITTEDVLKEKNLVGITSPPYSNQCHSMGKSEKQIELLNTKRLQSAGIEYSDNPSNIGNLPDKKIIGITSPPYIISETTKASLNAQEGKSYQDKRKGREGTKWEFSGQEILKHPSENNIANLPDKKIVGITSPPYSDKLHKTGQTVEQVNKKLGENFGTPGRKGFIIDNIYSENPSNIGNLPDKNLIGITSPPYEQSEIAIKQGDDVYPDGRIKRRKEMEWSGYSSNPSNIGNLPDKKLVGITSPPYENRIQPNKMGDYYKRNRMNSYGSQENLGNQQTTEEQRKRFFESEWCECDE